MLLLALTLAAYALAVTIGRGSFGSLNMALLLAAAFGVGLFVLAEARAESPLIRLAMFRDPVLSASLAMSALVSTVMMATLVVGPFYLSRALGSARRLLDSSCPSARLLSRWPLYRPGALRTDSAHNALPPLGSSEWPPAP